MVDSDIRIQGTADDDEREQQLVTYVNSGIRIQETVGEEQVKQ